MSTWSTKNIVNNTRINMDVENKENRWEEDALLDQRKNEKSVNLPLSTCPIKNIVNNTRINMDAENKENLWEEDPLLDQVLANDDLFDKGESQLDCVNADSFNKQYQVCKNENNNRKRTNNIAECTDFWSPNILQKKKYEQITHSMFQNTYDTGSKLDEDSFYGLGEDVRMLYQRARGIKTLHKWQDECLRSEAVKKRKNLICALPTSGGKTLVAEILMLQEIMCNKRDAVFILPFVAIVQEKVQALAPFALEFGFLIEEYAGTKGGYPPKKRRNKNSIYVCTIEKAVGLINSLIETKRLQEIGIIIVDELHLLGQNGGRGATLEGLLTKIIYVTEHIHVIGMSATIGNLTEIAQFLHADLYVQNFRPITLKEYVKCENDIWLVDLHAEDIFTDMKKINYRYTPEANKLDPDRIGGLVADVVPQHSCLVFCSSRRNCENVALLLVHVLTRSLKEYKAHEKQFLLDALSTQDSLCPILRKTIPLGVAYHHSGLTSQERKLLEDSYREGTLCVLCCTSTLAAGVNLPAKRVILRSPYIGREFLKPNVYKQMVGRAGRTGMEDNGESIIICKSREVSQVKELLISNLDDCLSTLHTEKNRGLNNLILSAILLSIAPTRRKLHQLVASTLLSIQEQRLGVNIKKITDEAIADLLKTGVIKVQEGLSEMHGDSLLIESEGIEKDKNGSEDNVVENVEKKIVIPKQNTLLELSGLGRAAMKGSIDLQSAYTLYDDLKQAQKHLILFDDLHLLYLVTPYDIVSQVKLIGSIYYDMITNLSSTQMETPRLLGINEACLGNLRIGIIPRNVESRVVHRFYVTLILYELWNQQPIHLVADKYELNRGILQNFLSTASTFASSVVRFCEELGEFWAFKELLSVFGKKLSHCGPAQLELLMELPSVKIGRARQLYNAGYTTLQDIAKAEPRELQNKIKYLPKRIATEIVASANLMVMGKIEELRDEAEYMLDSIDEGHFKTCSILLSQNESWKE